MLPYLYTSPILIAISLLGTLKKYSMFIQIKMSKRDQEYKIINSEGVEIIKKIFYIVKLSDVSLILAILIRRLGKNSITYQLMEIFKQMFDNKFDKYINFLFTHFETYPPMIQYISMYHIENDTIKNLIETLQMKLITKNYYIDLSSIDKEYMTKNIILNAIKHYKYMLPFSLLEKVYNFINTDIDLDILDSLIEYSPYFLDTNVRFNLVSKINNELLNRIIIPYFKQWKTISPKVAAKISVDNWIKMFLIDWENSISIHSKNDNVLISITDIKNEIYKMLLDAHIKIKKYPFQESIPENYILETHSIILIMYNKSWLIKIFNKNTSLYANMAMYNEHHINFIKTMIENQKKNLNVDYDNEWSNINAFYNRYSSTKDLEILKTYAIEFKDFLDKLHIISPKTLPLFENKDDIYVYNEILLRINVYGSIYFYGCYNYNNLINILIKTIEYKLKHEDYLFVARLINSSSLISDILFKTYKVPIEFINKLVNAYPLMKFECINKFEIPRSDGLSSDIFRSLSFLSPKTFNILLNNKGFKYLINKKLIDNVDDLDISLKIMKYTNNLTNIMYCFDEFVFKFKNCI